MKGRRAIPGIALCAVAGIMTAMMAQAIQSDAIGIRPTDEQGSPRSWFVYTLDPGAQKDDNVVIQNLSSQPQDVLVYPVDATATTEGSFAPLASDAPRVDVSSWLTLASNEAVTLGPNESKTIPFHLSVPQNATPGIHTGAIIVQLAAAKTQNQQNVSMNVVTRVGARMYVTVTGQVHESLALTDVTVDQNGQDARFWISLKDDGNTRVVPDLQIDVAGQSDSQKLASISQPGFAELLPGLDARVPVAWTNARGHGVVLAHATIAFDGQTLTKDLTFDTGSPGRAVASAPAAPPSNVLSSPVLAATILGTVIVVSVCFI